MYQSILKDLFNGEINPGETVGKTSEDHILRNKIIAEKEYFKSILSVEDWTRLEELSDMELDVSSSYGHQCFEYGYRLCMALMLESAFVRIDINSD